MFIESKDLPLRGPSSLFEYMLKCCCFSAVFIQLLQVDYLNNLRYVKWAVYPEKRRALLFNRAEKEEGAQGSNNLTHSSKWKKSSIAHVIMGESFISPKDPKQRQ